MRVGVFGGTFDPPHIGHAVFAESARVQHLLDRVVFFPAGDPYHRRAGSGFRIAGPRDDLSPAAARLAMTRLAVRDNESFAVDDREVLRQGPTYTVDTLEELASESPDSGPRPELFLLLGADSAAELGRWKSVERLSQLATLLVAGRDDRPPLPPDLPLRADAVDMPRIDITSTLIRRRVRAGLSVRYLVADPVAEYISTHSLYRATSG